MQSQNNILEHLIRYQKIYLGVLFLIILTIPYAIRYFEGNYAVIGAESYFNMGAAEQINGGNFYQNPYHFLLALNFHQSRFIYPVIQVLLGLFSLLLLFGLLKKFEMGPKRRFFFLLFLVISPAFIYTFTILNHYAFFIFLNLLGFTLLLNKNRTFKYLSFAVFSLVPFLDIFSALLTLSFLMVYYYRKIGDLKPRSSGQFFYPENSRLQASFRFWKKEGLVKILGSWLVILALLGIFLKKQFLLGPYFPQNNFVNLLADLGGLFGLSLFAILLAIFGLALTWKKKNIYPAYVFLILFSGLFFYNNSMLIYLSFIITFFASLSFIYFLNRRWKVEVIKNSVLFLLILGLLFSTLVCVSNLTNSAPSRETKESLLWLRDNTFLYKTVLASPSDSYFIEYFSRRPAFSHYQDKGFIGEENITNQIFQSSYTKITFPLLEQNKISHIYLSAKTKADLSTEQGLIFLLQDERFKRIYNKSGIEIWQFK